MIRRLAQPRGVDLPHLLHHLKQPGAAGNTIGLQRGRDGQADGFLAAARVRHDQIGHKRVKPAVLAFDRRVEGFQIDGNISSAVHGPRQDASLYNENVCSYLV